MNRTDNKTFGEFLYSKRSPQMTLTEFSARVEKSTGYMCDLENDHRNQPNRELLKKIVKVLSLGEDDSATLFDLAGKGRKEVSTYILDYIMMSEVSDTIRLALHTAKNSNASVEERLDFDEDMNKKKSRFTYLFVFLSTILINPYLYLFKSACKSVNSGILCLKSEHKFY